MRSKGVVPSYSGAGVHMGARNKTFKEPLITPEAHQSNREGPYYGPSRLDRTTSASSRLVFCIVFEVYLRLLERCSTGLSRGVIFFLTMDLLAYNSKP